MNIHLSLCASFCCQYIKYCHCHFSPPIQNRTDLTILELSRFLQQMELPSDDGNSQMELPGKRSKRGPKLQAQPAVKDKDFEIEEQQSKREIGGVLHLQNKRLALQWLANAKRPRVQSSASVGRVSEECCKTKVPPLAPSGKVQK